MRLDLIVSERLGISRTRAQNIIKTGGVRLGDKLLDKPSLELDPSVDLVITDTLKYASLGGMKMENAIEHFRLDLQGKVCLDVGAANGGFTDCLLRKGANKVVALDLNVAFSDELASDPRVEVYDKTNVKTISELFAAETFDLISVDLSFISLCALMPLFYAPIKRNGFLLVLFKPQFEVGRKYLPKSGVVRDKKAIEKAFDQMVTSAEKSGFHLIGECLIPELFPDKNPERTVLFEKVYTK